MFVILSRSLSLRRYVLRGVARLHRGPPQHRPPRHARGRAVSGETRTHSQPSTLTPTPSTLNPQPSTLNPQPSNPQPSTLNSHPTTLNPQPSPLDPQPSTQLSTLKPSTLTPHPSPLNPQPSTLNRWVRGMARRPSGAGWGWSTLRTSDVAAPHGCQR